MDKETLKYMKDKVTRCEQLEGFKIDLNDLQTCLLNDQEITISVKDFEECVEVAIGDNQMMKLPNSHIQDEYGELLREIKDNLIDSIGMTIVKINEIMEEL